MVQHLPSKPEVLSSDPSASKKKKKIFAFINNSRYAD
jgi:hypothetical protein